MRWDWFLSLERVNDDCWDDTSCQNTLTSEIMYSLCILDVLHRKTSRSAVEGGFMCATSQHLRIVCKVTDYYKKSLSASYNQRRIWCVPHIYESEKGRAFNLEFLFGSVKSEKNVVKCRRYEEHTICSSHIILLFAWHTYDSFVLIFNKMTTSLINARDPARSPLDYCIYS